MEVNEFCTRHIKDVEKGLLIGGEWVGTSILSERIYSVLCPPFPASTETDIRRTQPDFSSVENFQSTPISFSLRQYFSSDSYYHLIGIKSNMIFEIRL